MKLSIIIPVYNVEKYIEKCLKSCIFQNVAENDYEIIVVNDGSTDSSFDIAKCIVHGHHNITLVSQVNKGLSAARNTGLHLAKGNYVWFVDSDDWITESILQGLLNHINTQEIVFLSYEKRFEPDLSKSESFVIERPPMPGREWFTKGFSTPIQFHVFKRSFLENFDLKFFEGIFHEDSEFMPRALWLADNVTGYTPIAYCYRIRSNSIMTSFNPQKGHDYIFVAKRLYEFFQNIALNDAERRHVANYISQMFTNGLHNAFMMNSIQKNKLSEYAYSVRDIFSVFKEAYSFKYRLFGTVLKVFPRNAVDIYLLMMKFHR